MLTVTTDPSGTNYVTVRSKQIGFRIIYRKHDINQNVVPNQKVPPRSKSKGVTHVRTEESSQASADAMLGTFQIPRGSGAFDQAAQRCAQLGLCLCLCRGVEDAREARPHSSRHDCQVPQVLWSFDGVH